MDELTPQEHGEITRNLLLLSRTFRTQPDAIHSTYQPMREAEHELSVLKAKTLLKAPLTGTDGHKLTVDERKAWVEVELEDDTYRVMLLQIAHQYQLECSFARNKELATLQTLAADRRAEMTL